MIKSNATATGWVTYKSSPTVVKILNPMQGFPAWKSDKWTGNHQGI